VCTEEYLDTIHVSKEDVSAIVEYFNDDDCALFDESEEELKMVSAVLCRGMRWSVV
jgi:hypothetical protein